MLLIAAITAAGGIFLLDMFYFSPHVAGQRDAALREQASRAADMGRMALQREQLDLLPICAELTRGPEVRRLATSDNPSQALINLIEKRPAAQQTDLIWVTDSHDKRIAAWGHRTWPAGREQWPSTLQALDEQMAQLAAKPDLASTILMKLSNQVIIVARREIGPEGETSSQQRWLWVARRIDAASLMRMGTSVGGDVVLVGAKEIPPSAFADESATHALWLTGSDTLAVAWYAYDPSGTSLGCFRADIPVVHINRQAATSRRMILIVLSLSVALVLLVIMGMHVLVAGPVLRLLERLQSVDTGEGHKDLAKNLHCEPRVLAKHLESAFDKLAHMSKTDELTGLANRRHFEEVFACFYEQAKRYNRPLSMIVMDLDFFKAINDTGGHAAGDELLKYVASSLENACRKADLPARLGGDEFAVLLPETGVADAEAVADRILQSVSAGTFTVRSIETTITASIGLTDLNAGEIDSPESMRALADSALYAAKEAGRNRVVKAHDLDGVSWNSAPERGKVNTLCKKLAGLDNQFKALFLVAIEEIMEILEQRDPHMAAHARKVQHYSVLIAEEMELPERVVKRIEIAAMLHDIGMLTMPDAVLLCPDQLDEEQTAIMRKHPLYGVRIMERMAFLEQEIPAVRHHHERYDGQGYPEGLAGPAIPLTARILSVADVFDAMTSSRTFRNPMTHTKAIAELQRVGGTQLDPVVVDAFVSAAGRLGDQLMVLPNPDDQVQDATKTDAPTVAPQTATTST